MSDTETVVQEVLARFPALTGRVTKVHANYHVPISNTATGLMVFDNQPAAVARAA
jgi:hypothetical protein